MRAFERCGYSPRDLVKAFAAQSRQPSRIALQPSDGISIEEDVWTQVLTLWSRDPEYVDERGAPQPLPTRGTHSVEALIRRVGSTMSVEKVCDNMVRTGAARRVGRQLTAIAGAPILFPPGSRAQSQHHLDMLLAVLLNLEHNTRARADARWVERQAISHDFPQSALDSYSAQASERAQIFLLQEDAKMHRTASLKSPTEKTVRASLLMLFSAQDEEGMRRASAEQGSRRQNSHTKRSRGARASRSSGKTPR